MFNIFKKKNKIEKQEPLTIGNESLVIGATRTGKLHFDLGETNKEASNFYLECEKNLFKIIIGVFERQDINSRLIDNEEIINNLYTINNAELNSELYKFKQLPTKIQHALIVGLEIRLREYISQYY